MVICNHITRIWNRAGCPFFIGTYNIDLHPTKANAALLEVLPGAKTLQNPKVSFVGDAARMAVLHNSGVGAPLAVVILGLRDRHKDNMMISADGTLFHIDFGYIGGLTPRFDFTDLPIPQRLQANLDFEKFVADCGLTLIHLQLGKQR